MQLHLKYVLPKKDAKLRHIHFILLLQEFDFEIQDKKGCENVLPDHISHLELLELDQLEEINKVFFEKTHFQIGTALWYIDFVNYAASSIIPSNYMIQYKKKFFNNIKHYFWEDPILYGRVQICWTQKDYSE